MSTISKPHYELRSFSHATPHEGGVAGFLSLLRHIIRLGRVQEIHIGLQEITWSRYVPLGEPLQEPEVTLGAMTPAIALGTATILSAPPLAAFDQAWFHILRSLDRLGLFICGVGVSPATNLSLWLKEDVIASRRAAGSSYFLGHPLFIDGGLPDDAFFVFAGSAPGLELHESTHAVRVEIPVMPLPAPTPPPTP